MLDVTFHDTWLWPPTKNPNCHQLLKRTKSRIRASPQVARLLQSRLQRKHRPPPVETDKAEISRWSDGSETPLQTPYENPRSPPYNSPAVTDSGLNPGPGTSSLCSSPCSGSHSSQPSSSSTSPRTSSAPASDVCSGAAPPTLSTCAV